MRPGFSSRITCQILLRFTGSMPVVGSSLSSATKQKNKEKQPKHGNEISVNRDLERSLAASSGVRSRQEYDARVSERRQRE